MSFEIGRVDVWAGEVQNHPGELAKLLTALRAAGVDLESAILRPAAPLSGVGVLFVAPLIGQRQQTAAGKVGLRRTSSIHAVRIAGPDRPGLLAEIAELLAGEGINVSGLSSTAIEQRSVHYFRFEAARHADRAVEVLKSELR